MQPLASYGTAPVRLALGSSPGTPRHPSRAFDPRLSAERPLRRCPRRGELSPAAVPRLSSCPASRAAAPRPSRCPASRAAPRPGARRVAAPPLPSSTRTEEPRAARGWRPLGLPQCAPRHHGPASTGRPPVSTETKRGRAPEDQVKRAGRSCPPPRGAGLGTIRPRCLILAHPDGSSSPGYLFGSCAFWRPAGRWGPRPSSTSLRRARFP